MFDGLDFLGAVSPAMARKQQSQARAATSGQRALNSAQRIAQTAPRLARAVAAAGQKALAASKPAPSAKPAKGPAPPPKTSRPNAPQKTLLPSRLSPNKPAPNLPGPAKRTRLGTELPPLGNLTPDQYYKKYGFAPPAKPLDPDAAPGSEENPEKAEFEAQKQADAFGELADAAASAADLLSELQGLVGKLPSGIPLAQQGQDQIAMLERIFVQPIEKALEGAPGAPAAQDLVSSLNGVMVNRDQSPPQGVWAWVAQANAYLRSRGQGGAVASITINPASPTVAPGSTLQLTAVVADATGKGTTPGSPVQWSSDAGAAVDKNGNFTAASAGSYKVTASADGIKGTTTVAVQAGAPAAGTGPITVQPLNPQVAPGTVQQFTATVNGQPPPSAVVWSVTPKTTGAAIDTSGNFLAQMPGNYTITATSGGQTGTSLALVSAAAPQMPAGGGYGGGGGGGGGSSGGGGSDYGGGADYGADDGGGYADPGKEGPQPDDQGGDDPFDDSSNEGSMDDGLDMMGLATVHWMVGNNDRVGDSWLSIHMPDDYRNAAKQLKASADNLNLTAANEPGWQPLYAVANDLYSKYADIGVLSSLTLTDSAWNSIADAQRRVEEFATQMRSRGKAVVEPEHKPIDTSLTGGSMDWLKNHWPWLAAAGVAAVTIPVVVPPLISLAAARKVATR